MARAKFYKKSNGFQCESILPFCGAVDRTSLYQDSVQKTKDMLTKSKLNKSYGAKIPDQTVKAIKALLKYGCVSHGTISNICNVTPHYVYQVSQGFIRDKVKFSKENLPEGYKSL